MEELMLALQGIPGSMFSNDSSVEKNERFVSPSVLFCDAFLGPELEIIEHLDTLTDSYLSCYKFCETNGMSAAFSSGHFEDADPYTVALCEALTGVLTDYRDCICQFWRVNEGKSFTSGSLTELRSYLTDYLVIFPDIAELLSRISANEIRYAKFLSIFYAKHQSGHPVLQRTYAKILHRCNAVLLRQLVAWMSYAKVPKQGFFIRHAKPFANENQITDVDMTELYELVETELPSFISTALASDVLFVGQCIARFLTNAQNLSKDSQLAGALHEYRQLVTVELAKAVCQSHLDKPRADFVDFFDRCAVSAAVDKIKTMLSTSLWSTVNEKEHLMTSLSQMKSMFLLGRGELFLAFIDQARDLLSRPGNKVSASDVDAAMRRAAATMYEVGSMGLEKFPFRVSVPMSGDTSSGQLDQVKAWRCIDFAYKAEWPLDLVVSQASITKLNRLFQYLLRVKLVHQQLLECWMLQNRPVRCKIDNFVLRQGNAWQLRMQMIFLISCLQDFLQTDVLQSVFEKKFLKNLDSYSGDFLTLRKQFHSMVDELTVCSLAGNPMVFDCILGILKCCEDFANLFSALENKELHSKQKNQVAEKLHEFYLDFQRRAAALYKLLLNTGANKCNPYLVQLLFRLDFNLYFSSTRIF